MRYIRDRLKRIYGGLTPRQALHKYQDMSQEYAQYFYAVLRKPTFHRARTSYEDSFKNRLYPHHL
eukprot:12914616-Prorocentrum_lima.AAC.1